MTYYERLKRKRLGDVLVDEGLLDREVVIRALQEQQLNRRLLSDILLDSTDLPQYDLARVIVKQYQVPFLDVESYSFHKDLIEEFPPDLLRESGVVPLDRYGDQVTFVCQEIPSQEHVDRLRGHVEGGMYFFVGLALDIRKTLTDYTPEAGENEPSPFTDLENATSPIALQKAKSAKAEPSEILDGEPGVDSAAWKDLFDSANESILSEIGREEPEAEDE